MHNAIITCRLIQSNGERSLCLLYGVSECLVQTDDSDGMVQAY